MIPYGHQSIDQQDIDSVVDVLRSDFITQGPAVERFESIVADYCHVRYAVAVSSATAALHLACISMGVTAGDLVWTTPITFTASANCGRYCGADVDFIDIDETTVNMSVELLEAKLRKAKGEGRLPKVVIPVHFGGLSCDMARIAELADEYGFQVLEDASHAIGGTYRHQPVGSCKYSSATVFSFHPVKVITTGEGGMFLTNDADLAQQVRLLRAHGITRDSDSMVSVPHGPWYYEQLELGFNYRITDIQSALGCSQMSRLDEFVDRRNSLADRYDRLLAELPVRVAPRDAEARSAFHLYVIRLGSADAALRRRIFDSMRASGVGVQVHYIPVHLQPYYRDLGFSSGDFPRAEAYYADCLTLPLYPDLTETEQDFVVESLASALAT